ncbi:unnamed protein product [Angiostrongylus costaricensis]|uniref:Uncharacterized protein n=1 Tax=Angiostrongylus costaricensis TaxID=334426 RepID=A0A158PLN6_ANGCS|nr:unnamed protein product [Angiostrongylus costaricensis]
MIAPTLARTVAQDAESLKDQERCGHAVKTLDSIATLKRFFNSPVCERGQLPMDIAKSLSSENFRELLPEIDTFIFDADGVLWLRDEVIPGSRLLIDFLIKNNKQIIVLTNNATKSRAMYAKKFLRFGFNHNLNEDSVVSPAAIVADALYKAGIAGNKKVYLIGSQGIRDEMDELGIEYFGHGPELQDGDDTTFLLDIDLEVDVRDPTEVGAVVVGYDKHFNYHKLMKAANYLQQPHCLFLATNEDETCPGSNPHTVIPDAGPLVAAVRCASGREPTVMGKPYTPAYDYIKRQWNIDPERTMIIGDRTNTDVKFGRDHGLKTMLVLSGCHQLENIMANRLNERFDMVPSYYATSLGALVINMITMTYNEVGMEQLTSESFGSLLEGIDTFICGADVCFTGFLWLREGVILEASSLINMLIENKKEIIILTNDTTRTRANHEQKLKEHRFSPKLSKDHIITPGLVAADFIKKSSNFKGKAVYVIASEGVQDEFASSGIKYFGEGPVLLPHPKTEALVFTPDLPVKTMPSRQAGVFLMKLLHQYVLTLFDSRTALPAISFFLFEVEDVGAVVVGFDENFNYKKMMKATNYLKNQKCLFLATNDDAAFSSQKKDIIVPDAGKPIIDHLKKLLRPVDYRKILMEGNVGAIVAAVSKASNREAIVIGKPHRPVFDYIKKKWHIDETRTMMICSRFDDPFNV